VIITHEMEVVKEICHRCAVMQEGRVVEEGPTYDIFSNPVDPLTKKFIETVLSFELPSKLIEKLQGKLVKLQFRGDLAAEAIVSDMLQTFTVKGNIHHGKVEYIQDTPLGIFMMELLGEEEEVERAIDYLRERVSIVEVVENG